MHEHTASPEQLKLLRADPRSATIALQVNIGLRVLTRPVPNKLPEIYRTLGTDYGERVLPSIIQVSHLEDLFAAKGFAACCVTSGAGIMVSALANSSASFGSGNAEERDCTVQCQPAAHNA